MCGWGVKKSLVVPAAKGRRQSRGHRRDDSATEKGNSGANRARKRRGAASGETESGFRRDGKQPQGRRKAVSEKVTADARTSFGTHPEHLLAIAGRRRTRLGVAHGQVRHVYSRMSNVGLKSQIAGTCVLTVRGWTSLHTPVTDPSVSLVPLGTLHPARVPHTTRGPHTHA